MVITEMKVNAQVQKWGNGLAIRISGAMRTVPNFYEGAQVEVDIREDGLLIKKVDKQQSLPFSEAQLLAGLTPQTAHSDELIDPMDKEFDY